MKRSVHSTLRNEHDLPCASVLHVCFNQSYRSPPAEISQYFCESKRCAAFHRWLAHGKKANRRRHSLQQAIHLQSFYTMTLADYLFQDFFISAQGELHLPTYSKKDHNFAFANFSSEIWCTRAQGVISADGHPTRSWKPGGESLSFILCLKSGACGHELQFQLVEIPRYCTIL